VSSTRRSIVTDGESRPLPPLASSVHRYSCNLQVAFLCDDQDLAVAFTTDLLIFADEMSRELARAKKFGGRIQLLDTDDPGVIELPDE
jgi:hypothetical protein